MQKGEPMDWEMESRGAWTAAPFKTPANVAAGKKMEFTHQGIHAQVTFTSSTDGIVCSKGKEYPCRLKENASMVVESMENSCMFDAGTGAKVPFKQQMDVHEAMQVDLGAPQQFTRLSLDQTGPVLVAANTSEAVEDMPPTSSMRKFSDLLPDELDAANSGS
jgi:hypothetical protein